MRVMLALIFFGLMVNAPANAQKSDANARLRALLEKKFNKPAPKTISTTTARSRTRGVTPARPRTTTRNKSVVEDPKELIVIRPGGKVDRVPVRKAPDRRSETDNAPSVVRTAADETPTLQEAWNYVKSFWEPAKTTDSQPSALRAGSTSKRTEKSAKRSTRKTSRSSRYKASRMRKSKAFGVVPDVYIVQFKNTVTGEQIDNVIQKYNLNVVGNIPALGVIYVKRTSKETNENEEVNSDRNTKSGSKDVSKSDDTRSVSPRSVSETATQTKKLQSPESILNPDFLKNLRKEPGINAATVHTTIAPKSIPRPTNTTVTDDGQQYSWTWRPGVSDDGNWGLKRMRMPSVWHILKTHRSRGSAGPAATMGFLDSGFSWHSHLNYNVVHGLKPGERLVFEGATCEESHGTHVAGIAGAAHGLGRGIDGIVPDARIDAIPLQADDVIHGMEVGVSGLEGQNTMLFVTAVKHLVQYLEKYPVKAGSKRVVNISLGFNWGHVSRHEAEDISEEFANGELVDEHKKSVVISFASMLQQWLKPYEENTVFVIAGGNDSEGLSTPLHAKWSSPFSYLGLAPSETFHRAPNFIVVEALDRSGNRASFSNGGGQVSAPGVDIMSTIGGRSSTYGVCDGTSQAAPHVTALAAILMELAPEKTPTEIVEIITRSAVPDETGKTAPRVDALEAVLKARPQAIKVLADLNSDGVVDGEDLRTYKHHHLAMTTVFLSTLGSYFFDLNLNGQVEDNEHWYPRIDLNGSGRSALTKDDARCLQGRSMTDLDIIKQAWATEDDKEFDQTALKLGLVDPKPSISATIPQETGCKW